MTDTTLDASCGREFLQQFRTDALRLKQRQEVLRTGYEQSKVSGAVPPIRLQVLEESIETEAPLLMQKEQEIRQILSELPGRQGQMLQARYLDGLNWEQSKALLEDERQWQKQRTFAYEGFWILWQQHCGHMDPILRAKRYRMWKRYYQGLKASGRISAEAMKEGIKQQVNVSQRQMDRMIHLLKLIPELQLWVVRGQICLEAAYQLSFLAENFQHQLVEIRGKTGGILGIDQARALRGLAFSDWFHQSKVIGILSQHL